MKLNTRMLPLLAVIVLVGSCHKEETTTQQLNKVEAKTTEAAQDLKDYSYAQKAEFTEKMQSQLTEIDADLDRLSARIENATETAKAEIKPKLQALREKADQLGKQVDAARNATESSWDTVKSSSGKAYFELKNGFNEARQWVSDKIAP